MRPERRGEGYPFDVPVVAALERLAFDRRVTFFVGENGSGKSTVLEAIATACGFGPEGGSENFAPTVSARSEGVRPLADALRLSGSKKLKRGFFLRAESFFDVATRVDELGAALNYGGLSLHEQSHGESFLALLRNRFWPGGLYLLDEPEAALSPQRQLSVLALIHDLIGEDPDTQFLISTHSPILCAFPGATILSFDDGRIAPIPWVEVPAVQVTRSFLANPQTWLNRLFEPDDGA